MTAPALVLVEPGAHRLGGHRHRTLTALWPSHVPSLTRQCRLFSPTLASRLIDN
ncbi:hypothetical protein ABZX30_27645 [Streptomyces sp. NPDC004542]|uniref:hypothetical protein n=1 Tax=Streptomyces sp. NPDC004542 TaxID=3154281 RepID=UPI0033B35713